MIDKKLLLLGLIIGIIIIATLPLVESAIPPTRAYERITTSNSTVFAFNSSANVNLVGSGITITGSNGSKTIYFTSTGGATTFESLTNVTDSFCTTNQVRKAVSNQWVCADDLTGAGATDLEGLSDVDLTAPAYLHILQYNPSLSQWVNKAFSINNQTVANDFQIVGINNATGVITRNQFSVNTITCSGTDKLSAIDNVTGIQTCSTDQTGGTARQSLVGVWETDVTKTNIGTSFVNVYITGRGNSIFFDTNGKTEVRLVVDWTKSGTGTQTIQVLNVLTSNVLVSMNLVTGLNDSGLLSIPAFATNSVKEYKLEVKSTTVTDDPIFLGASVFLK